MEKSNSVDQHFQHPAVTLITKNPELFARQGSVVATHRKRDGKTYGPYYRLAFRLGGRQKSIYLGRDGRLVGAVRDMLTKLKKPLCDYRLFERMRRSVLASLRMEKLTLRRLLSRWGLRLKGMEVRGWRFSPLRKVIRRVRFGPSVRATQSFSTPAARMMNYLQRRDGYVAAEPDHLPDNRLAAAWSIERRRMPVA